MGYEAFLKIMERNENNGNDDTEIEKIDKVLLSLNRIEVKMPIYELNKLLKSFIEILIKTNYCNEM